jgi:copper(I)-binding protein
VVRGISTAITVRRAAAIAIAGAAATALSACGASLGSQTEVKQSAIAGVNIDEGDISLRDLQVEFQSADGYAAGDDAALRLWIGNEGSEEISLESIETDAGTITFVDPVAEAEEAMEDARETADETPAGDATTGESTEEPSADDAASEPAEADELTGEEEYAPIAIAPAEYARLDQGVTSGAYFLIENLQEELVSGDTIDVVFHFSDGTEIPASLPVGQALEPDEREYYEPEEAAEGH